MGNEWIRSGNGLLGVRMNRNSTIDIWAGEEGEFLSSSFWVEE